MERLLIVEDDPQLAHLMTSALEREGYSTMLAINGLDAVQMAPQADLMLLDLGLPGLGGLEVIRELREADWNLPILVVSAQGSEEVRVRALELGADDYITKPMSVREMVARVRALLRRARPEQEICVNDLRIVLKRRQAFKADQLLELSPTELDLLLTLAQNPGEVWSRERLLQRVWGAERGSAVDERVVDSYVALLRRKLGDDPKAPRYVETVFGQGYRLRSEP
ncbi:MAG: response regulator transcription factor [Meiothermus sp.]|uniref:response regulator transcription factor n=1 Tax=Meiothermus sp. TaxID=1955249 RepID=UPI00298F2BE3|nr:response regulator transcription factor [Meiothermus sp.]MCX7601609.1 response regulator transcription factor [Meiothermus sp.]MDW8425501.1 response regulator transcription factor [Meiothermus sp.]